MTLTTRRASSPAPSSPGRAPGAEGVTAAVVAAVEATWAAIRAQHPDVPTVVLTLGSGTQGAARGRERLGHFAAGRWQPAGDMDGAGAAGAGALAELFLAGEGLRLGAAELLDTLLHEAAHGIAHTRGITDTSRQGRYHNARYRLLALEVGLEVAEAAPHGWAHTALSSPTLVAYAVQLEQLGAALLAWRYPQHSGSGDTGQGTGAGQTKNGVIARCACTPRPRQFRITASVLEAGAIVCELCKTSFFAT